jgi:hypothetical protein
MSVDGPHPNDYPILYRLTARSTSTYRPTPNWLPAPKREFQPTMRLYSPRHEALDGTWSPPPIKKAD